MSRYRPVTRRGSTRSPSTTSTHQPWLASSTGTGGSARPRQRRTVAARSPASSVAGRQGLAARRPPRPSPGASGGREQPIVPPGPRGGRERAEIPAGGDPRSSLRGEELVASRVRPDRVDPVGATSGERGPQCCSCPCATQGGAGGVETSAGLHHVPGDRIRSHTSITCRLGRGDGDATPRLAGRRRAARPPTGCPVARPRSRGAPAARRSPSPTPHRRRPPPIGG